MSLTDPIDCLPFPWRRGLCLQRSNDIIADEATWSNLLTIDEVVALWAKIETIEIIVNCIADDDIAPPASLSSAGEIDTSDFTPRQRICGTLDRGINREDQSLTSFNNVRCATQFAYRTGTVFLSPVMGVSGAGIREIVTSGGNIRYSTPVWMTALALVEDGVGNLVEEAVQIGTRNESSIANITATGIVNVAGVDLKWIRSRTEIGSIGTWVATVSSPTASVAEWTFDGTINP